MAEATLGLQTQPTPILIFKGEGYEYWCIRMKTILRSRDLWETVETGISESGSDQNQVKAMKKKDALAMAIIQQVVHDQLFSRIAAATTAKETWDILRLEYQGDGQVKAVKLQGLRQDFEKLIMREEEKVEVYFSRVMAIVSQKRSYGEEVTDQSIVEKILRSLSPRYDYITSSMEAFQAFSEPRRGSFRSLARGRGRGAVRGRGRGCGRGLQCHECGKFGHLKRDCWYNEEAHANVAADPITSEEKKDDQHLLLTTNQEALTNDAFLLMAHQEDYSNSLWFID
uniref:uncharacterized protein LOC122604674 n=1 Tax=Erigeron canadensis TaxID=72917 RepID=UPI001CB94DAB|nr:uncharacterized protein LOC122604674 [Erigeron canadensis]